MQLFKSAFTFVVVAGVFGLFAVSNVSAQVIFNGIGTAEVEINDIPIVVSDECTSQCEGQLDALGRAEVLAQSASLGSDISLTIDPGSSGNFVQATPPSGINATLSIHLDAHVDYNGQRFESQNEMVLVSVGTIPSFPPPGPTDYTVQNDVTFSNGAESIVLKGGSTITMTRQ